MRGALSTLALLVGGCAAGVPSERVSAAQGSIRAAEEVGAPKVPGAALHLQLAKEESDQAQRLMRDGSARHAEGLFLRAEADAELAVALTREAGIETEAQQTMKKAETLEQKRR